MMVLMIFQEARGLLSGDAEVPGLHQPAPVPQLRGQAGGEVRAQCPVQVRMLRQNKDLY